MPQSGPLIARGPSQTDLADDEVSESLGRMNARVLSPDVYRLAWFVPNSAAVRHTPSRQRHADDGARHAWISGSHCIRRSTAPCVHAGPCKHLCHARPLYCAPAGNFTSCCNFDRLPGRVSRGPARVVALIARLDDRFCDGRVDFGFPKAAKAEVVNQDLPGKKLAREALVIAVLDRLSVL